MVMFLRIFVVLHLGQLVLTNALCINVDFTRIQQVFMAHLRNTAANSTADCSIQCLSEVNCGAFTFTDVDGTCSMLRDDTGSSASCVQGHVYKSNTSTMQHDEIVRLVPGPQSGRVEIRYQSTWGTVCDDGFTDVDARVVCRELGLPSDNAIPKASAFYGQGSGPIHLDDVNCAGNEEFLSQCCHQQWSTHNCGHGEDVGVLCQ
ncbi:scavenger receptor cysteine-rich domain-containing protein DMBT1-like [Haliotis cracherodii]|uniref:scavenger receptor cysteine-rich domain-containing protein DMBT1-like n=1 Tax=Haliotis cracherodii TaxID=6455 RepID=UPI0039EC2DC7